jgi:hypothetical protein
VRGRVTRISAALFRELGDKEPIRHRSLATPNTCPRISWIGARFRVGKDRGDRGLQLPAVPESHNHPNGDQDACGALSRVLKRTSRARPCSRILAGDGNRTVAANQG